MLAERGDRAMANTVRVVVLHNEDCPSTPGTIALIRKCVSDMGIAADVRTVLVRTQEEADALRFLGSPTVHVNGLDIEPAARSASAFGFM